MYRALNGWEYVELHLYALIHISHLFFNLFNSVKLYTFYFIYFINLLVGLG